MSGILDKIRGKGKEEKETVRKLVKEKGAVEGRPKELAKKEERKPAYKPAAKASTKPEKKEKEESDSKAGETRQLKGIEKAHGILRGVLETEKSSGEGALGKYYFIVKRTANKPEIAKAVSEYYGVKVEKVNVARRIAKKVRFGLREGKQKGYKKAVVTLKEGETINFK